MSNFARFRSLSSDWKYHLEAEYQRDRALEQMQRARIARKRRRERLRLAAKLALGLTLTALAGIALLRVLASSTRDDIETRDRSFIPQHTFALLSGAGVFYGVTI